MDKLVASLEGQVDRSAQFKTVITYINEQTELQFTGIVVGFIGKEKKGTDGFGYDPIFYPENEQRTFAQMSLSEKNQFSHRARAMSQFLAYLSA